MGVIRHSLGVCWAVWGQRSLKAWLACPLQREVME